MRIEPTTKPIDKVPKDHPRYILTLAPHEQEKLFGILDFRPILGQYVIKHGTAVSMSRHQLQACGVVYHEPLPNYVLVFIALCESSKEEHHDLSHAAEG